MPRETVAPGLRPLKFAGDYLIAAPQARDARRSNAIMLRCKTDRPRARRPTRASVARPQVPHPSHEDAERCTDGFSSEKFAKVPRHGHVSRGNEARRFSTAANQSPCRAERLRNPGQEPSSRRRQVPLGLSRWRRPLHLRRAVQARNNRTRAGAPRAGRSACRRRLRACDRRGGRCARHLGPRW